MSKAGAQGANARGRRVQVGGLSPLKILKCRMQENVSETIFSLKNSFKLKIASK